MLCDAVRSSQVLFGGCGQRKWEFSIESTRHTMLKNLTGSGFTAVFQTVLIWFCVLDWSKILDVGTKLRPVGRSAFWESALLPDL